MKEVAGSIREGSMTTVTQWFDGKPVNIGNYQWELGGLTEIFLWHWNGRQWGFFARETGTYIKCWTQDHTWRGLAVKPRSGISSK
jgi:hypothetical protein